MAEVVEETVEVLDGVGDDEDALEADNDGGVERVLELGLDLVLLLELAVSTQVAPVQTRERAERN